jgi:chitin disaccharide deacetylase
MSELDPCSDRPTSLGPAVPQTSSFQVEEKSSGIATSDGQLSERAQIGVLIINADDWGRSREATDRTLECVFRKTVSSVSAMVYMEDSERGAQLALGGRVDAGLHLNLTTPFSAGGVPSSLLRHHEKVVGYLTGHRLAQVLFHPGLRRSFQYVVTAQLDEFRRLYQRDPDRIDGHHHMHLCANVLLSGLLPEGTITRRNFSFRQGQKSLFNRMYRQGVDAILARRHQLTDFFFSLPPFEPASRLQQIFSLSCQFVVEVETHPEKNEEYKFLAGGEIYSRIGNSKIAQRFFVTRLSRS